MTSKVVTADWVSPIVSAPVPGGAVVIERGRIAWIGPAGELPSRWRDVPVDARGGVLTPGLVNAHTHLQYTHFDAVGRGSYSSFEHWSDVFGEVYDAILDPEEWRHAAHDGVQQAIATGTTVFAEIVTNDEARGALSAGRVAGIEYLEAIGLFEWMWHESARTEFLERLDAVSDTPAGISPHAPYSLDGGVVADLVRIAARRGMRVHSHLGESSVEADLYRQGDHAVLRAYGDLRDEFELVRKGGAGHTTAGYADSIGLLNSATHVAHGIYLDRADRDLLLTRGTRVALCPRSNAVIGLAAPPVADYLREGHDIAVGTDSLASSPSLDLMGDVAALAVLAREQGYDEPDLYDRLLHAATLGGARAMDLADAGYGALTVGGPADIAVFDVAVMNGRVAESLITGAEARCTLTISAGEVLHDRAA